MSIVIGNLYPGGSVVMGLTGANNGLSVAGANAQLGGVLTKNTTVDPAAFQLLLGQLNIKATGQNVPLVVASFKNQISATTTLFNFPGLATPTFYRIAYSAILSGYVGGTNITYEITAVYQSGTVLSYLVVDNTGVRNDSIVLYAQANSPVFFQIAIAGTSNVDVAATLEVLL